MNNQEDHYKQWLLDDSPSPFDIMQSEAMIKQNEVILEAMREKCELEADLAVREIEFKSKFKKEDKRIANDIVTTNNPQAIIFILVFMLIQAITYILLS